MYESLLLVQEKSVCRVWFGARAILGREVVGGFGAAILARVGKRRRSVADSKERQWANEPRSGEGVLGRATRLAAGASRWKSHGRSGRVW